MRICVHLWSVYDGATLLTRTNGVVRVFTTSRKTAQQTAQRLIAGHFTLIAWWTLRHAGVFDAVLKQEQADGEGLNPLVFATRTNMAPDVLQAFIDYLTTAGLLTMKGDGGGGRSASRPTAAPSSTRKTPSST